MSGHPTCPECLHDDVQPALCENCSGNGYVGSLQTCCECGGMGTTTGSFECQSCEHVFESTDDEIEQHGSNTL